MLAMSSAHICYSGLDGDLSELQSFSPCYGRSVRAFPAGSPPRFIMGAYLSHRSLGQRNEKFLAPPRANGPDPWDRGPRPWAFATHAQSFTTGLFLYLLRVLFAQLSTLRYIRR